MASFCKKEETEKAKLQRELEYYTSLVLNYEKQVGKIKSTKSKSFANPFQNSSQIGKCSKGIRHAAISNAVNQKSLCAIANSKRSVISPYPQPTSSFLSCSVAAPKIIGVEKKFPCNTSLQKFQQRTVLYKTNEKASANISTRLVLPPQVSQKSINKLSLINSSTNTNCLGELVSKAKTGFLKSDSEKHINELKLLTLQLEQRKQKISLAKNRISSLYSSSNSNALSNSVQKTYPIKSPFERKNGKCQTELQILKIKLNNLANKCKQSKSISDKVSNTSNVINALSESKLSTPMPATKTMPSLCSTEGTTSLDKESLFSSNQVSKKGKDSLESKKTPDLVESSISSTKVKACLPSDFSKKPSFDAEHLKISLDHSLKAITPKNKLSLLKTVSSRKLANSQTSPFNKVSTPLVKRVNPQKLSSNKKHRSMTKLISSKYKVVNKKASPTVGIQKISEANAPCSINTTKTLGNKSQLSMKISETLKKDQIKLMPKLSNSIKKRESMTKLIASKYKLINRRNSDSLIVSGNPNRNHVINKPFKKLSTPTITKTSSTIKAGRSKYKVVNIVKTPKRISGSLRNSTTPKYIKKGKYALKRKSNSTKSVSAQTLQYAQEQSKQGLKSNPMSPLLSKPHFTHNKLNNLVVNNPKKYSKPILRMKSTPALKTKYKVVNRRGSSKKTPKSLSPKSIVVHRTKSGVDIDLLLELAAEKEEFDETTVKTPKKKAVLSKRVYKSKNTIINKNISSDLNSKMARMIKAKYLLNRSASQRPLSSKKFNGSKYFKGYRFVTGYEKTPTKFYNRKINRNYFKYPVQNNRHKLSRNYKTPPAGYNTANKRRFTYRKEHFKTFPNQAHSTPISKVLASRALHQSINRVINATAKKKMSKVNTYCMFYNRFGRCNKGLKCTYVHDPSKIAVCTRFLRGTCKNKKCLFSHERCPGKMAICSFFLSGSCTKIDCPYRHETLLPNTELCKAFVQGYCPDGKQCKKAHVLVCPHFIQGFCEKGDACAFPHPPSKEKKISKPNEKSETPMEEEDLMEKVSRYFQSSSEKSTGSETDRNVVVPRRQVLPEQPSFIAL